MGISETILSVYSKDPVFTDATKQFAMIAIAQNCLRKEKSGELRSTLVAVARANEHVKQCIDELHPKFTFLLNNAK